jgi:hypothetical protein
LALHAARDFFYGVLFGTLPWLTWKGTWVVVLLGVIVAEIILTLWDFVVEIGVRKDLGDVYAGERVTHAVMGILYGGMLALLVPRLSAWWGSPTALIVEAAPIPAWLRIILTAASRAGPSPGRWAIATVAPRRSARHPDRFAPTQHHGCLRQGLVRRAAPCSD